MVDDTLYVLAGDLARTDSPSAFLSYSLREDTWSELPLPAGAEAADLVAAGSKLVAVSYSDEFEGGIDSAFDPRLGTWTELPDDPLGPSFDRQVAWLGDRLLLTASDLVPQPGAEGPSITRLATLDETFSEWTTLPDSDIVGGNPTPVAGRVVFPATDSADGGEVGNWGRPYPFGGIFDPSSNTWSPLPDPPSGAGLQGAVGTVGQQTLIGGHLLNPATGEWTTIPDPPWKNLSAQAVVTSDDAIFLWGGVADYEHNVAVGYLLKSTATAETAPGPSAISSPGPTPPANDAALGARFGDCPAGEHPRGGSIERRLQGVASWREVESWEKVLHLTSIPGFEVGQFIGKVNSRGPSVSHWLTLREGSLAGMQWAQENGGTIWLAEPYEGDESVLLTVIIPGDRSAFLSGFCAEEDRTTLSQRYGDQVLHDLVGKSPDEIRGYLATPTGSPAVLLRADSLSGEGSDGSVMLGRLALLGKRCVGVVAGDLTRLIRFPADTTWDGTTLQIPGSDAAELGDEVELGGSASPVLQEGRDSDVPTECAEAAESIWYAGGVVLSKADQ